MLLGIYESEKYVAVLKPYYHSKWVVEGAENKLLPTESFSF